MEDTQYQNEIKSEIWLMKAKLQRQTKEIEWTRLYIKQVKDFIHNHKAALNNYMTEKNTLEEEKNNLIGDNIGHNLSASNSNEHVPQFKIDGKNDFNSLPLFSENYEVVKISKPKTIYQSIIDRISKDVKVHVISYANQTFIPNDLKFSTTARKLILYRISNNGEYNLHDILCEPVNTCVDIHVAMGAGELISMRGQESWTKYNLTALADSTSYYILECQTLFTNFVILVRSVPMILAIDLHSNNNLDDVIDKLPTPEGYLPRPLSSISTPPDSFIKRNLTSKEIRNRLMFFDAVFARDITDCLVPIAVTVLNYQGGVLVNSVMCPRTRIKDYCQVDHGLSESDLIGKSDPNEVLRHLYNVVWDKILVGENLKSKIKALKIDMDCVCGVRELRGSVALKKLLTLDSESLSVQNISDIVLEKPLEGMNHQAEVNANGIRNIYLAVESFWEDSEVGDDRVGDPTVIGDSKECSGTKATLEL